MSFRLPQSFFRQHHHHILGADHALGNIEVALHGRTVNKEILQQRLRLQHDFMGEQIRLPQ
ncbi:hypothetical protein D3C81_1956860 [compost metagenome]